MRSRTLSRAWSQGACGGPVERDVLALHRPTRQTFQGYARDAVGGAGGSRKMWSTSGMRSKCLYTRHERPGHVGDQPFTWTTLTKEVSQRISSALDAGVRPLLI
jgi:hypothetical protein